MYAGVAAGVPFEEACGGNAECCTCHVYVPIEDIQKDEENVSDFIYKEPLDNEMDALDFAQDSQVNSRLACQMKISRGCQDKVFIMVDE